LWTAGSIGPSVDYPLAVLVIGVLVTIDPRNLLLTEQHGDWYQTLATVNGVLVSLAGVAVTLVLTVAPNDRLERVLQQVGPNLGRLVMSCIGGLVLTTAGFAALFLLETSSHRARLAATAGLVVFSIIRFARLWRVFQAVIAVLTTPTLKPPAAPEGEPWQRPAVGADDYSLPRRRPRRVRSER